MFKLKNVFRFMHGNILVLTITQIISNLSINIPFTYLSLYILALKATPEILGFVLAVGTLPMIISYPIAGFIADQNGRVKIIGIASYLLALTFILYAFAPNWQWFCLGTFLQCAFSVHFPATAALMVDSLPLEQRGTGFATVTAVSAATGIMSPYIASWVVTKYGMIHGMRGLWLLAGLMIVVTGTISIKFLKEPMIKTETKIRQSIPVLIKESWINAIESLSTMSKRFKNYSIIIIMNQFFNSVVGMFWVIYFTQIHKLSNLQWGVIGIFTTAIFVSLSIPAGSLIDRYGTTKIIICALAISILPVYYFPYADTFMKSLISLVLISIVNTFLLPSSQSFMANISKEKRGRIMAALGSGSLYVSGPRVVGGRGGFVCAIPIVLGSILGGYLYSYNPRLQWVLFAVSLLISLFLFITSCKEP